MLTTEPLNIELLMKKCLLLLMAFFLLSAANAQGDTMVVSAKTLMHFLVQSVDRVVLLKWSVDEPDAFKGFDVERAEDGKHFIKVGSKLSISKNSEGEYDFVDATPKKNTLLFYRLKFIAKDGFVSYSEFKETKLADTEWAVRLKQNPVRNNIEIEVEVSASKQVQVAVISHAGQQVASQTFRVSPGKNGLSLSLQNMLQGLYQLIVDVGSDRKSIPFIKE